MNFEKLTDQQKSFQTCLKYKSLENYRVHIQLFNKIPKDGPMNILTALNATAIEYHII